MIEKLWPAVLALRNLIEQGVWQTLLVNDEKPHVQRVWTQWTDTTRINLHRIRPCIAGESLVHRHSGPSAMLILEGVYEMGIGRAEGDTPPEKLEKIILTPGSAYEMTDPDGYHYVRPHHTPTLSIMLTEKAPDGWRSARKPTRQLDQLSRAEKDALMSAIGAYTKYALAPSLEGIFGGVRTLADPKYKSWIVRDDEE